MEKKGEMQWKPVYRGLYGDDLVVSINAVDLTHPDLLGNLQKTPLKPERGGFRQFLPPFEGLRV